MVNLLDAERAAQREEFLKRERAEQRQTLRCFSQLRDNKPKKDTKLKTLTFEQKLELTNQWLKKTYPHLFSADDYVPLDLHLLRDLKADYKNNVLKKGYPQEVVIKAAISRYKQNIGYLERICEGTFYINLIGEQVGTVSKQEEEAAQEILKGL